MTCAFLCFPLALDVAWAFGMAILMMDPRKGVNHWEPRRSRYTAAYTGAGISTAAGIKDCHSQIAALPLKSWIDRCEVHSVHSYCTCIDTYRMEWQEWL